MERHIKFINIIFENCDSITVPREAVYLFRFVTNGIHREEEFSTIVASEIHFSIDTTKMSATDSYTLYSRKDITHMLINYESGEEQYVQVPYPFYFCWSDNPYQDNYLWEKDGNDHFMLDIDIEKYWSLLSIRCAISDWLRYAFSSLTGLRITVSGYWNSIKRHFKWRH